MLQSETQVRNKCTSPYANLQEADTIEQDGTSRLRQFRQKLRTEKHMPSPKYISITCELTTFSA